MFPLGVKVWPSEFGYFNTVLQESLGALKAFNLSSGLKSLLKFNACHGEKPKFFQITLDSEMKWRFSTVVSQITLDSEMKWRFSTVVSPITLDSEIKWRFSTVVSSWKQVEFCVYVSVESRILRTGNGGETWK